MDTLRNTDINSEAVLLKEIKIPVLLKHLGIESVDSFVDTAYNGKLLQLRISNNDYFDYNSDKNGNAIDLVMFLKDIDRKKAKVELIKFLEEIARMIAESQRLETLSKENCKAEEL